MLFHGRPFRTPALSRSENQRELRERLSCGVRSNFM